MSPCRVSDNTLNPGHGITPSIPGFGISGAPIQLPFPDFAYPNGIPEDLLDLINRLGLLFPSSLFKPNLDNYSKNVLDAVMSLLNQVAPYLSLYKFFFAAINLIVCILDVLCALLNPFSLSRAIRRLFKNCLPAFLNLMPWIALIAMIISLMLLLLALIEYLIATILGYLDEIRRNIALLLDAVNVSDAERSLSAARKIASLLCLIQNLFAILVAFGAILSVVEALAQVGGRNPCGSGATSDCCDDSVCPPFIRNNPEGFTNPTGTLVYLKQLNHDLFALFPSLPQGVINFGSARNESWQFTDNTNGLTFKIADIITPIDGNTYWPEGLSFDANSSVKKIPYFLDMRFFINPTFFINMAGDTKGPRFFQIKNCIITQKPYIGLNTFNNGFIGLPNTGTATLTGGLVFEDDGTTPVMINGVQATLTTFVHLAPANAPSTGPITVNDTALITNVTYTVKQNHDALVSYALITLGCLPEIATERAVIGAQFADIRAVVTKIDFPNITGSSATGGVNGTIDCLQKALAKFRTDVSLAGADQFQADILACLGTLRNDTANAYKQAVGAGFDQFNSSITIDPTIQFVGSTINVVVTLKDAAGNPIAFNMPSIFVNEFILRLDASVTLGEIATFNYDGKQSFISTITSKNAGNGELTVSFDKKIFSLIKNRDQADIPTSIVENILPYTFVGNIGITDQQPVNRRDDGDVARDDKDI